MTTRSQAQRAGHSVALARGLGISSRAHEGIQHVCWINIPESQSKPICCSTYASAQGCSAGPRSNYSVSDALRGAGGHVQARLLHQAPASQRPVRRTGLAWCWWKLYLYHALLQDQDMAQCSGRGWRLEDDEPEAAPPKSLQLHGTGQSWQLAHGNLASTRGLTRHSEARGTR